MRRSEAPTPVCGSRIGSAPLAIAVTVLMTLSAPATPRPPASRAALGAPAHHVEKHFFQRLLAVGLRSDAAGVPSSMMRPASSRMTRSASRSTSAMLCEANSSVAPRLSRIMLELPPDPVGGVGVERGGRLVEQEKLRRVEQRLGEADAGLLAGRQFAGRAVEQLLDLQILGDIGDALGARCRCRKARHRRSGSASR